MLNEIEFFAALYTKIIYIMGHDFLMLEVDGFRVLQQFLIPVLTGGVGGLSLMVMASLSDYGEFDLKNFYRVYIKLALLGAIAGVAAVNLLNPSGDISQVAVLGLIAGLSGFSYLKRSSLVDGIHEDAVLKGIKKNAFKEVALVIGGSKLENLEVELEDENEVETEEAVNQDEFESDTGDNLAKKGRSSEVDKFIYKKVREWMRVNPDATAEEIIDFHQEVLAEIVENPELIDLEE